MHYTVTIQPDEGPTLVADLEVNGTGTATVRTITAHAPEGASITGMPSVDFDCLARALSTTATPEAAAAVDKPAKRVSATAPAATGEAAGEGKRAYRRAPADDELLSVVHQVGDNVPAIADHFDVPPRTVARWLKGLRDRGSTTAE